MGRRIFGESMADDSKVIEVLKLDYEKTLAFIDKTDLLIFKIRNWAILTSSAVIAFGFTKDSYFILTLNLFVISAFLFIELIYKGFHESGIGHSFYLENQIQSYFLGKDIDSDYVFGLGHAIVHPDIKTMIANLKRKNRWHIVAIYGLLVFASLFSMLLLLDLFGLANVSI